MVGLIEDGAPALPPPPDLGFTITHQKVFLDLDLRARKLKGKTEITIAPLSTELKTVRLNCRQAQITKLSIGGRPTSGMAHMDPYKSIPLPWHATAHQYHMLQEKVDGQEKEHIRGEPELHISVPKSVRLQKVDPLTPLDRTGKPTNDSAAADLGQSTKDDARYMPIVLSIEYVIENIRDGLNFVGWEDGDLRYPHVYTGRGSSSSTCCLFPCIESITARCTPRTLGDAFRPLQGANGVNGAPANGAAQDQSTGANNLSDEDQALDLTVLCSGDVTDEVGRWKQSCNLGAASLT
jgi:transcription initiation factor TFIID subunit 2